MKMLGVLFVIWILLSIGCFGYSGKIHYVRQAYSPINPEMVIPVYVDKDFGAADLVSIAEAVDQWNYVLNGYLVLRMGDRLDEMEIVSKVVNGGIGVVKIKSLDLDKFDAKLLDHEIEIDGKKVPVYTLGFADRVGGHMIYLVRDRLGNKDVKPIVMHELGHVMGSDHVGHGLMTPLYSGEWECVDKISMEQVARYWKIPEWRLNWCYKGDDPLN